MDHWTTTWLYTLALHVLIVTCHSHGTGGGTDAKQQDEALSDKEHIKEHLDQKATIDLESASEDELAFYYFHIHDKDTDRMLDGLEMMAAMRHGFDHQMQHMEDQEEATKWKNNLPVVFQSIVTTVDQLFNDTDIDRNGYLSYTEFSVSRRAHKLLLTVSKYLKEVNV